MSEDSALYESPSNYVQWKIENFCNLQKRVNYRIESPSFSLGNAKWYLQIMPNGEFKWKSFGWIGMYLWKEESASAYHVAYRIGIRKVDGTDLKVFNGQKTFTKAEKGWGTDKLIKRSALQRTEDAIDPDGSVTLFCNARILNRLLVSNSAEVQIQRMYIAASDEEDWEFPALSASDKEDWDWEERDTAPPVATVIPSSHIASQILTEKVEFQSDGEYNHFSGVSTLVEDLKSIYISRNYSDVTILVQNKKFYAHRNILGGRSAVFASMFEHEFAEKINGEVEISDCDPDTFEQFLLFLYIGKVDDLIISKAVHLYITADKYDVKELKEECVRCMVRDMSIEYVCDVIRLAMMHDDSDLLKAATDFFINNVEAILPTPKWQQFLGENPVVCNELLIKVMKSKK